MMRAKPDGNLSSFGEKLPFGSAQGGLPRLAAATAATRHLDGHRKRRAKPSL
jgi:hypothetical protein